MLWKYTLYSNHYENLTQLSKQHIYKSHSFTESDNMFLQPQWTNKNHTNIKVLTFLFSESLDMFPVSRHFSQLCTHCLMILYRTKTLW